jgi:two-component system, chemotaxis family, CheB/CheR fusion protein
MRDWHTLIVEDDLPSCEMLAFLLRYYEIHVDIALNAEQALSRLNMNTYTFAIIDLSLPGMNGWTLLQEIKDNPKTAALRCVAVTAYYDAKVAREALQAGFVACFPKPLEPSFIRQLETTFA